MIDQSDIATKIIEEGDIQEPKSFSGEAGAFIGKKLIRIDRENPEFIQQCTKIVMQIFDISQEEDDLYEMVTNSMEFATINSDIDNMRIAVLKVGIRVKETGIVNDYAVKIQALPMILLGSRLRSPLKREAEETRELLAEAGLPGICLGPAIATLTSDGGYQDDLIIDPQGLVIEAYATNWRGDHTIRDLLPYLHAHSDFEYSYNMFKEIVEGLILELANYEQIRRVHRDLKTDNVTFSFANQRGTRRTITGVRFIDLGNAVRTGGNIGEPYMGETPNIYRPSESLVGHSIDDRENIQPSYDLAGAAQIIIESMMAIGIYIPPNIGELRKLGFDNSALKALILKSFPLIASLNYAPLLTIGHSELEKLIREGLISRNEYNYYFKRLLKQKAYFSTNFELLSKLPRKLIVSFTNLRNVCLKTHGCHVDKPENLDAFTALIMGALWEA